VDPACKERHRVVAGLIKPLDVIDDHHDRLTGSGTRQNVESCQEDQERLGRASFLDPECRPQCAALGRRQSVRHPQDWAYQVVEPGERQFGFGFDTGRPQDKASPFLPVTGRRFEQN
jgi:hypothetical protein